MWSFWWEQKWRIWPTEVAECSRRTTLFQKVARRTLVQNPSRPPTFLFIVCSLAVIIMPQHATSKGKKSKHEPLVYNPKGHQIDTWMRHGRRVFKPCKNFVQLFTFGEFGTFAKSSRSEQNAALENILHKSRAAEQHKHSFKSTNLNSTLWVLNKIYSNAQNYDAYVCFRLRAHSLISVATSFQCSYIHSTYSEHSVACVLDPSRVQW